METIPMLINPLNQMVIRRNPLRGFDNQVCLDVLDSELNFKKTKYAEDDIEMQEFLEKVKAMRGIPNKGWVHVAHPSNLPLSSTWKHAMRALK